jgi:hypothetical protein
MSRVAIGFRVKSGHAIAIVLTGSAAAPSPLLRADVALSDPGVPETRQPYHDGFYRQQDDADEIARRVGIVERCARQSVAALVASIAAHDRRTPLRRAALVVGSVIDPATVGNPHIRAHASEGQLFRTALADALSACGIESEVIVDKQLPSRARSNLGSASQIRRTVAALGDAMGKPWRADEKAAAAAAWMALATSPRAARARTARRSRRPRRRAPPATR